MVRARLIDVGRLALLLVLAVILQTLAASQLSFLGVTADVFVIVVVLVAVGSGSFTGLVFGFVAGLTADVVFLDPIGMRTFMYLLIGYWAGRYVEEFGLSSAWVVVLLAGTVSLGAQTVYGILQMITGTEGSLLTMVVTQVLPAAMFDGLLSAPLYLGLTRVRLLPQQRAAGPMFG
ncbi:MAG TPA: rod shape-determining protein MreD [Thermoleophilia bacterium]|nr:rod shape-determining protein MreD [Thermoleophilia bacterium]